MENIGKRPERWGAKRRAVAIQKGQDKRQVAVINGREDGRRFQRPSTSSNTKMAVEHGTEVLVNEVADFGQLLAGHEVKPR
jgi:hypothetical protein